MKKHILIGVMLVIACFLIGCSGVKYTNQEIEEMLAEYTPEIISLYRQDSDFILSGLCGYYAQVDENNAPMLFKYKGVKYAIDNQLLQSSEYMEMLNIVDTLLDNVKLCIQEDLFLSKCNYPQGIRPSDITMVLNSEGLTVFSYLGEWAAGNITIERDDNGTMLGVLLDLKSSEGRWSYFQIGVIDHRIYVP